MYKFMSLRSLKETIFDVSYFQTFYYEVKNFNNMDFKIEDSRYELDVGETLNVRFIVKYHQYGKIPLIKEIRFNGQRICESNSSRPSSTAVNTGKGETNR
jgi:hypothetical protein